MSFDLPPDVTSISEPEDTPVKVKPSHKVKPSPKPAPKPTPSPEENQNKQSVVGGKGDDTVYLAVSESQKGYLIVSDSLATVQGCYGRFRKNVGFQKDGGKDRAIQVAMEWLDARRAEQPPGQAKGKARGSKDTRVDGDLSLAVGLAKCSYC